LTGEKTSAEVALHIAAQELYDDPKGSAKLGVTFAKKLCSSAAKLRLHAEL
jgi:hypothetical protein